MHVVYFTAGTIGAGHFARGVAIERGLRRAGFSGRFTRVGPRGAMRFDRDDETLSTALSTTIEVSIDPLALADAHRAPLTELACALDALSPTLLIVDLFWAPLRRLLPLRGCETWLLLRLAPAHWLDGPPGLAFARDLFSRVIAIEPGVSSGDVDEAIAPIVAIDRDERRPRGALRARLGVDSALPLHVVAHAGAPGEWSELVDACAWRPLHVLTPTPTPSIAIAEDVHVHDGAPLFPLGAWLGDADTIVSGAGYNAYWEARWLGHDARTTWLPRARPIDDQRRRIAIGAACSMRENGADT
ncbi:MAG: hypothetical protein ACHREM_09645, partial [Polyangiales bacterium]